MGWEIFSRAAVKNQKGYVASFLVTNQNENGH